MKHILIIEDDTVLSDAYAIVLKRGGYNVTMAADGMEGWKILREELPDLVLLDLLLPGLNGHEILQAMGKIDHGKRPKVMAVTNLSSPEDKALATELGADKYFVKSNLSIEQMLDEVADILK